MSILLYTKGGGGFNKLECLSLPSFFLAWNSPIEGDPTCRVWPDQPILNWPEKTLPRTTEWLILPVTKEKQFYNIDTRLKRCQGLSRVCDSGQ